ncbi:MAG TPA: hypothetical protein VMZ00_17315 [Sporichthya sp.]|nr:hypothetical protein [Sporichthya sp.]
MSGKVAQATDAASGPFEHLRASLSALDERVLAGFFALATWVVYRLSYQGEGAPFNYFTRLADAYLHGRTDLIEQPSWLSELIPRDGKWYVVFPPMPAFLAVPFVRVFGTDVAQPEISILVGAASAGVAFLVLDRWFPRSVAIWSTILWAVGTNYWYHAEVGSAWYYAQICAALFVWLALLEGATRSRPHVIGLLVGCAFLCRVTTIGALVFFVVLHHEQFLRGGLQQWRALRPDLRQLGLLAAGLAPAFAVAAWYNNTRFGSPTEFGYDLIPGVLNEPWYRHGLVSHSYVGEHLDEMFTALPRFQSDWPFAVPNIYTMAIWVTTPALVLIVLAPLRNRLTVAAWGGVAGIVPFLLTHGGNGFSQFGNRFSIDYLPFLVLLMAAGMRSRPAWPAQGLVVFSVAVNVWGVVMISGLHHYSF